MAYQGELDGFCGVYSIVNAISSLENKVDKTFRQKIFDTLCEEMPKNYWPKAAYKGLNFSQLKKLTKIVQNNTEINKKNRFKFEYPFEKSEAPENTIEYFKKFDTIFLDENAKCAIIGVNSLGHWLVIRPTRSGITRIEVIDSTANKEFFDKNRASFRAGVNVLSKKPNQWVVAKNEMIVLCENTL